MPPHIILTRLSQSDVAIQIESLVEAIRGSANPAFKITYSKEGKVQVRATRIARYFDNMEKMASLFYDNDLYVFSEHLEVFWDACQDIRLERSPFGLTCLNNDESRYLSTEETLNLLTGRIRYLAASKRFQRRMADRRYQVSEQQTIMSEIVDQVLDYSPKTVVVRLDLHYRQEVQHRQRVEDVFQDLDKLIREIERNPIFEHLIWHVCGVEQGKHKGYHFHTAFFFDGTKVVDDQYKARQIDRLWQKLTDHQGYCFRCNDDKERYGENLGIGIIYRDDIGIRSHVYKAVHYLAKLKEDDPQHLRVRPAGARCLRKGLFPKPRR